MQRNRHIRLTAILGVVGLIGLIAVGSAFALRPILNVTITSQGFSPQVLRIDAADIVPAWKNTDSVAHTVTFDDSCSVRIEPGATASAPCSSYRQCAGETSFSVDGLAGTGKVIISPQQRDITLSASSRSAKRGQVVTLSGSLTYTNPSPPSRFPKQAVVIRRKIASGAWATIGHVMSTGGYEPTWHAKLAPMRTAVYQVQVSAQPHKDCTLWATAKSRQLAITVR